MREDWIAMGGEEHGAVTVEMFPVREGCALMTVALSNVMTLHDLVDNLNIPANTGAILVNGVYVGPEYRLRAGDHIHLIRFMSGG